MAQRATLVIAHRRLAEEREVFLGVLSHDLRSPLNTITMGGGYIARGANVGEPELRTHPAHHVGRAAYWTA